MAQTLTDRARRLQRLRRLGVRQGVKHIPTPPPKPLPSDPPVNTEPVPLHFLNYEDDLQHPVPIDGVVPGTVIENSQGKYYCVEARYPLSGRHGELPLEALLEAPMQAVAAITGDDEWLELGWQDVLFIDLETTGLQLAAGTVAFLIGVGYLDGAEFVVRQIFMRDFDEEPALLHDLESLCRRFKAVASFNGKTFDLPLLENRFVLARLLPDLLDAPHFDLLHPARRIWRRRLPNCKLATLEAELLGVERTQADVPGYFIPSLYRKYLVDQDARPMAGIFYHNEVDIVSMAALAPLLIQHFTLLDQADPAAHFQPIDMVSVGFWLQDLGQLDTAETILKLALTQSLPDDLTTQAKTRLAYLLKRQTRYSEAESIWQELVLGPNPLPALEALAKYYEWQSKDFDNALKCIDYALVTIEAYLSDWQLADAQAAWEHRKKRVQRKREKQAAD